MESKTIRVKRSQPRDVVQFDDGNGHLRLFTNEFDIYEELDIVITPVASPEERLREARRRALVARMIADTASADDNCPPPFGEVADGILSVIERVDAEFAKRESCSSPA